MLPCNPATGWCPKGCHPAYSGDKCSKLDIEALKHGCSGVSYKREVILKCRDTCRGEFKTYFQLNNLVCECTEYTLPTLCNEMIKYRVCPIGYYGYNCSKVCHCADNSSCLYEELCPGSCQKSWEGKRCKHRIECEKGDKCVDFGEYHSLKLCPKRNKTKREERLSVYHQCTPRHEVKMEGGAIEYISLLITSIVVFVVVCVLISFNSINFSKCKYCQECANFQFCRK